MNRISRRTFLASAALSLAASQLPAQGKRRVQRALAIPAEATGPQVPRDFVGLSYEVQQFADPTFFSGENEGLIRACKGLASGGVLRLGGNTGEFAYWKPTPNAPEPKHPHTREVVGEPKAQYYAVTPEAVRNLASFLKATGWSCIYGIGMGTNTPERAAEEAAFAAEALGDRLQYFQIGNEVDLFGRHLRDPKTWSAKAYLEEWIEFARAVAGRVPGARFGMPDVAARVSWLTEIADAWGSIQNPPHVVALTHHYYFGGPATNPDVNIANLLKPATMAKVQEMADEALAAARKMGVPVRMTEGNTCYRGGKPGLSDVFAAALWAADYALLLASNSYSGVNLHGGTQKPIANGLGGFLPGDVLLRDQGESEEQIEKHPHPFYTPIASFGAEYRMEPVAYGLKFAGGFAGATLARVNFSAQLQATGVNATAYAARLESGHTSIIVLNKDAETDLELSLDFGAERAGEVRSEMLLAPALDSRVAEIRSQEKSGLPKSGTYRLTVPCASGVRLTLA